MCDAGAGLKRMPSKKIITVVGARPQFVKAAVLSRAIAQHNQGHADLIQEIIVHTGQHYDANMSEVFFRQLEIPEPSYNLEIGSSSHGVQTGRMLEKLEGLLLNESPDLVLVYGDTNSTLAAALAAAKLHIPVAHVEAGLRSFNKKMPEEVNRILTDHVSKLLYCPTAQAVFNLSKEGIFEGVLNVGDVMYDGMLFYRKKIESNPRALADYGLSPKGYILATVHRAENTDAEESLREIFAALADLSKHYPVVLALHPRTRKRLSDMNIAVAESLRLLDPLPYLEMIELELGARMIVTDSGGVQKEAYFTQVPCLTLRNETEWVETVDCGANILCGTSRTAILQAFEAHESRGGVGVDDSFPYGDGHAAEKIIQSLLQMS